jgi:hypothetical protein
MNSERDASRMSWPAGSEKIPVTVLFATGTGADACAHVRTPAGVTQIVRAGLITEGTGLQLEALPGRELTAVVAGGELAGFELPQNGLRLAVEALRCRESLPWAGGIASPHPCG